MANGHMLVGKIIRAAREDRGLSVSELARRVGVTPPTIERIETGQRKARSDIMARLVRQLRLDPVEVTRILAGEADMPDRQDTDRLLEDEDIAADIERELGGHIAFSPEARRRIAERIRLRYREWQEKKGKAGIS